MRLSVVAWVLTALAGCYAQMQPHQCPTGWLSFKNYCYYFNNNATGQISWQEAQNECKARQAGLLRIETQDEYTFISQSLAANPAPAYWTALNNLPLNMMGSMGKAAFMWGDDEMTDDNIVKAHWDKEPDNTPFDDCVHISIQGTLSVDTCTKRHGYVCEIQKTQTAGCPLNWNSDGGNMCYFVSNVTNWPDVKTWSDARTTCTSVSPFNDRNKARLLSITSRSTQAYLTNMLSLITVTTQVYWTGLNDIVTEGTFVWDGNSLAPFNNSVVSWRQEPNNLGGNEHCGSLLPGARFSDSNCQTPMNYICRMGLNEGNVWNFNCGTWLRAGTKCVSVYSSPRKAWADARQFCLSQGGDLYQFHDEDDVMWMRILAPSSFKLTGYFIGLTDQGHENTFLWPDGSQPASSLLDWDQEPSTDPVAALGKSCAWISYTGYFLTGRCNGPDHAGSVCETKSGTCAPGWLGKGQSCYLFDTTWRTHNEGRDFCKANSLGGNGQLLAIDDQAEKNFIKDHLATLAGNGFGGYWTALTKGAQDGGWYWPDPSDDDPMAVQKFVEWSQEPNNWNNNENCVQVNIHGELNDVVCASPSGFICQRALGASASAAGTLSRWTTAAVLTVCVSWLVS